MTANSPDSVWGSNDATQPRSTVLFVRSTIGGTERGGDDIALGNLPPGGRTGLPRSYDQSSSVTGGHLICCILCWCGFNVYKHPWSTDDSSLAFSSSLRSHFPCAPLPLGAPHPNQIPFTSVLAPPHAFDLDVDPTVQ